MQYALLIYIDPSHYTDFSPEQAALRHGVRPGMRVLEIGPGAGYLTGATLDRIGSAGLLVCLDVQRAMLRKLRSALAPRAVDSIVASGSVLPFRDGAFDLVVLVHVLGEIPDHAEALRECALDRGLEVLDPRGPAYVLAQTVDHTHLAVGEQLGCLLRLGLGRGVPRRTGRKPIAQCPDVVEPSGIELPAIWRDAGIDRRSAVAYEEEHPARLGQKTA